MWKPPLCLPATHLSTALMCLFHHHLIAATCFPLFLLPDILPYLLVDLIFLDGLSYSTASHLYIKVLLLLAQKKDSLFAFVSELPCTTIKCDPCLASLYTRG